MKRSTSGYRTLLEIKKEIRDYHKGHMIYREYPPMKRTVLYVDMNSGEDRMLTFNFPYLIFGLCGGKHYSLLQVAMSDKPIKSINDAVHFPGIWNIYNDEGVWYACGMEGNGTSDKVFDKLIDQFWSTGFCDDSKKANRATRKLFGKKFNKTNAMDRLSRKSIKKVKFSKWIGCSWDSELDLTKCDEILKGNTPL